MDISDVDVEKHIGTPSTESETVPTVDPDEKCRGKRVVGPPDDKTFQGYCKNVAGKGTGHLHEGRCKRHGGADGAGGQLNNQNALGNSGRGAPPDNDNAVTHGAFASGFEARLTEREKEARKEILADYENADGRHVAMQMVTDLAQKYQRSGDPRFARRYEALHETLTDDGDDSSQHAHIHQHLADGDHELTDQQRADIQAMFEDRGRTRTGDPDSDPDTDTNTNADADVDTDTDTDTDADVIDVEPVDRHAQDRTLDIEVDETVSTAAPDADDDPDPDPGSGPEKKREVHFDW